MKSLLKVSRVIPVNKRVMGIEPTYPAWKAGVLPLNYTREIEKSLVDFSAPEGAHLRHFAEMPSSGIEPETQGFSVPCSTN